MTLRISRYFGEARAMKQEDLRKMQRALLSREEGRASA